MKTPQKLFEISGSNVVADFESFLLPALMPECPILDLVNKRFDLTRELLYSTNILDYHASRSFRVILLGGRPYAEGIPELAITGVSASPGSTSCSISWVTNIAASSKVYYGLTDEYGDTVEDEDLAFYHALVIPGLDPATVYHFKVESRTPQGQIADTPDDTFETLAQGGGIWPVFMRLIHSN